MTTKEILALFTILRIVILKKWEIGNQYWPVCDNYRQLHYDNPWFLLRTEYGIIRIGMRKRVLSIDWEDTPVRKVITEDDTTKSETMVHAWTLDKAQEYLRTWLEEAKALKLKKETSDYQAQPK